MSHKLVTNMTPLFLRFSMFQDCLGFQLIVTSVTVKQDYTAE